MTQPCRRVGAAKAVDEKVIPIIAVSAAVAAAGLSLAVRIIRKGRRRARQAQAASSASQDRIWNDHYEAEVLLGSEPQGSSWAIQVYRPLNLPRLGLLEAEPRTQACCVQAQRSAKPHNAVAGGHIHFTAAARDIDVRDSDIISAATTTIAPVVFTSQSCDSNPLVPFSACDEEYDALEEVCDDVVALYAPPELSPEQHSAGATDGPLAVSLTSLHPHPPPPHYHHQQQEDQVEQEGPYPLARVGIMPPTPDGFAAPPIRIPNTSQSCASFATLRRSESWTSADTGAPIGDLGPGLSLGSLPTAVAATDVDADDDDADDQPQPSDPLLLLRSPPTLGPRQLVNQIYSCDVVVVQPQRGSADRPEEALMQAGAEAALLTAEVPAAVPQSPAQLPLTPAVSTPPAGVVRAALSEVPQVVQTPAPSPAEAPRAAAGLLCSEWLLSEGAALPPSLNASPQSEAQLPPPTVPLTAEALLAAEAEFPPAAAEAPLAVWAFLATEAPPPVEPSLSEGVQPAVTAAEAVLALRACSGDSATAFTIGGVGRNDGGNDDDDDGGDHCRRRCSSSSSGSDSSQRKENSVGRSLGLPYIDAPDGGDDLTVTVSLGNPLFVKAAAPAAGHTGAAGVVGGNASGGHGVWYGAAGAVARARRRLSFELTVDNPCFASPSMTGNNPYLGSEEYDGAVPVVWPFPPAAAACRAPTVVTSTAGMTARYHPHNNREAAAAAAAAERSAAPLAPAAEPPLGTRPAQVHQQMQQPQPWCKGQAVVAEAALRVDVVVEADAPPPLTPVKLPPGPIALSPDSTTAMPPTPARATIATAASFAAVEVIAAASDAGVSPAESAAAPPPSGPVPTDDVSPPSADRPGPAVPAISPGQVPGDNGITAPLAALMSRAAARATRPPWRPAARQKHLTSEVSAATAPAGQRRVRHLRSVSHPPPPLQQPTAALPGQNPRTYRSGGLAQSIAVPSRPPWRYGGGQAQTQTQAGAATRGSAVRTVPDWPPGLPSFMRPTQASLALASVAGSMYGGSITGSVAVGQRAAAAGGGRQVGMQQGPDGPPRWR